MRVFLSLLAMAFSLSTDAQMGAKGLRLSRLFSNGMMLQQKANVNLWGDASPRQNVTAVATWGSQASATADAVGMWKLKMATPKAGGPYTITIKAPDSYKEFCMIIKNCAGVHKLRLLFVLFSFLFTQVMAAQQAPIVKTTKTVGSGKNAAMVNAKATVGKQRKATIGKTKTTNAKTPSATVAAAKPTFASIKPLLIKNTCTACHTENKRQVGPAFVDVAKRKYSVDQIISLVRSPNKEHWPDFETPMPPLPQVPKADLQKIALWIKSLEQ